MISAVEVTRSYRAGGSVVTALDGVSIRIEPRTLTVMHGPSGSGKTTLINILGALDRPTSGAVLIDGADVTPLSESERDDLRRLRMGFVFQSVALIAAMSALENVEFALRIAGFDRGGRERRARECLTMVGLRSRLHHRPGELSGGEQQRVAIARGFAHRPQVLFADEPTAELDTHTGMQVVGILRALTGEQGVTVVMSSHDPAIVDLADRRVSLRDGRIAAAADPAAAEIRAVAEAGAP